MLVIFSDGSYNVLIKFRILLQEIEKMSCCSLEMRFEDWGAVVEVVTSPPLNRKVGCLRPTMTVLVA